MESPTMHIDSNSSTSSPSKQSLDFDNDSSMNNSNSNVNPSNTNKTDMDIDSNNNHTNINKSDDDQIKSEQFDVDITEEDYESIAIMIDELMKDDPAIRIKAIRSLPIISAALGEERTRNELIPYITQMIDDDDEVLLVLIEEIYRLLTLKLIGDSSSVNNQYSFCLIPPFERLCQVEEKIIRDEATQKFGKILYNMPYKDYPFYFAQYVLPLFKRLCHCDWHTARMSGATLIANAFSKFVELWNSTDDAELRERIVSYKSEMLTLLSDLCLDALPIVRRSAIITLGKMVSCLNRERDKEIVLRKYLPLFKKLSSDDQDNVRVFAVETLIHFSHIFTQSEVVTHLLYHIRLLCIDQAWRVRYIAADNFISLCRMLDTDTIRESMTNYFIRLLQDQEPEVRAIAISKIPEMSQLIGLNLSINKLIPIISKELICDANKYARASLASIIIPFCYLLPHQIVIEHILQCILKILKDEYPNVRLHVISNICSDTESSVAIINSKTESDFEVEIEVEVEVEYEVEITVEMDEFGAEIKEINDCDIHMSDTNNRNLKKVKRRKKRTEKRIQKKHYNKMKKFDISLLEQSIIPSIMELTLDNDWRVRLGIIEKFPALARQFGKDFFNQRLFDLCLASLEDNVSDIRLTAASNLFEISKVFAIDTSDTNKFEWTNDKLIPALIERIYESRNYLHRLIYLLGFKYLSEGLGVGANQSLVKEIIHFMSNDKVANVRFKACQIVTFLANHKLISKEFINIIVGKLQNIIENDEDIDVKYFGNQAIQALSNNI